MPLPPAETVVQSVPVAESATEQCDENGTEQGCEKRRRITEQVQPVHAHNDTANATSVLVLLPPASMVHSELVLGPLPPDTTFQNSGSKEDEKPPHEAKRRRTGKQSESLPPPPPEEPEDDLIPCEKCSQMHDWPHKCCRCGAVLCKQCTEYKTCSKCGQMHCESCLTQHDCSPETCGTQQKRQIEDTQPDEEQCKKMKAAKDVKEAPKHDPFAEFVEHDHFDNSFDQNTATDQEPPGRSESSSSNGVEDATKPLSYARKHTIAKEKLKGVKKNADAKWQEHIRNSTRIRQLSTLPNILDEGSSSPGGPERFEVHGSHRLMAIRSVVFCKQCGYWATKKSQKLKRPCNNKPSHSDGAHKLRRMMKGLHPDAKLRKWPEGHDARVPSAPVFLDWNSQ